MELRLLEYYLAVAKTGNITKAAEQLHTFLESYDFDGKTIVPFCTSASSGIGRSDVNLYELCPDTVTWLKGQRFGAGTSAVEIEGWLNGLGLVK